MQHRKQDWPLQGRWEGPAPLPAATRCQRPTWPCTRSCWTIHELIEQKHSQVNGYYTPQAAWASVVSPWPLAALRPAKSTKHDCKTGETRDLNFQIQIQIHL